MRVFFHAVARAVTTVLMMRIQNRKVSAWVPNTARSEHFLSVIVLKIVIKCYFDCWNSSDFDARDVAKRDFVTRFQRYNRFNHFTYVFLSKKVSLPLFWRQHYDSYELVQN